MKIKDLDITYEQLMSEYNIIRQHDDEGGEIFVPKVGTEISPAVNVIRPVGKVYSVMVHFLRSVVGNEVGSNLKHMIVCPTVRGGCPVCAIVKELYSTGIEEAKEKARRLKAKERNYWAIIARGYRKGKDILQDESIPMNRMSILVFGLQARQTLDKIVGTIGFPGDIENGFNLDYLCYKQSNSIWNKYEFAVQKVREKKGASIVERIDVNPLTEEEREYEYPNIERYIEKPSKDTLQEIANLFKITREQKVERFCIGDPDRFDEDDCSDCSDYKECMNKIVGVSN